MTTDIRILNSVRTIENTVTFKVFNYEQTVLSPSLDRDLLTDVYLQIQGHPTYLETGRQAGIGLDNLRIYLDRHDVTDAVIACIKHNLDSVDQLKLKSQYKKALDDWLLLEEKLGPAYPGRGIDEDRAIVKRLLEIQPLSDNLRSLGDKRIGWGGNLHIINFLYNQIDLSSISIKKVIERFNTTEAEPIDVSSLGSAKITFSLGPCRLFSSNWNPTNPFPGGSLTYRLEFNYFDPLLDRVASLEERVTVLENRTSELERRVTEVEKEVALLKSQVGDLDKRLKELDEKVKKLQTNILNKLNTISTIAGPNGNIMKILEGQSNPVTGFQLGVKDRVIDLNTKLSECERDIKSLQNQLTNITKNLIPDLKGSIDKIR